MPPCDVHAARACDCVAGDVGVLEPGPCGNGTVDPGELCDDGNTVDGDGCSADCQSTGSCGDGELNPGESCDDGNTAADDDCLSTCQPAGCGDGHHWLWMEECDDGDSALDYADPDCEGKACVSGTCTAGVCL